MCPAHAVRELTSQEITAATGAFNSLSVIGEGGFGKVYRAMVHHTPVAIKVMDKEGLQGQKQFDNELSLLSRLTHPSLVRLLFICREPDMRCLVYELMPSGNLEEALSGGCGVPWEARMKVAAQVGAALAYLHASSTIPVIHRDIKPANVFLDGDWNAKLGDFGLAANTAAGILSTARRSGEGDTAVGTWPYLAPEYKSSGTLTIKADVYAWGVSLLQVATGQVERLQDLVDKARAALAAGTAEELLDPAAGRWDLAAGLRLLRLGVWCCADKADDRPSMAVVATQLEQLWRAAGAVAATTAAAAGPRGGARP